MHKYPYEFNQLNPGDSIILNVFFSVYVEGSFMRKKKD